MDSKTVQPKQLASGTWDSLPFLEKFQANILKSNGRKHSWYLFIQFNGDQERPKPVILKNNPLELSLEVILKKLNEKLKKNYTVEELGKRFLSSYSRNIQTDLRTLSLPQLRAKVTLPLLDHMNNNSITGLKSEIIKLLTNQKKKELRKSNTVVSNIPKKIRTYKEDQWNRLKEKDLSELKEELILIYKSNNSIDQLKEKIQSHEYKNKQKEISNFKEDEIVDSILMDMNEIESRKLLDFENEEERRKYLFTSKPRNARQWVSTFANTGQGTKQKIKITSAKEQLERAIAFRNNSQEEHISVSFYFSRTGFDKLKIERKSMPKDEAFLRGANNLKTREILSDSRLDSQDQKNWNQPIDAMILLASNHSDELETAKKTLESSLKGIGRIVHIEEGEKLPDEKKYQEPFGFNDGISQPQYFKFDENPTEKIEVSNLDENQQNELKKGTYLWTKTFEKNLQLALVDEKKEYCHLEDDTCTIDAIQSKENKFGSYLVFRKLEQNKAEFERRKKITSSSVDKIIGRTLKDGSPLAPHSSINAIHYDKDPKGTSCPFSAHIRKVNPRGPVPEFDENGNIKRDKNGHNININSDVKRIIRRGIPYDHRTDKSEQNPSEGLGLLFVSFQASIKYQFEYIIKNWCNNPDFLKENAGVDALIGQPTKNTKLVKLKGMKYFYAPSMHFLENITKYRYLKSSDETPYA